jgi:hypothetical protein
MLKGNFTFEKKFKNIYIFFEKKLKKHENLNNWMRNEDLFSVPLQ